MIFDGHAYAFPSLRGDGGFARAGQLQRHLQQAIATHHQPAWRVRDRAPAGNGGLIDFARRSRLDALKEAAFRAADNGRFEWTVDGETYAKQYFPPSIADMSYPAERLVAEMDYAGVEKALLHRTPYLGIGNEFIAGCIRAFPDRLLGLAHVEEWLIESEPDACVEKVRRAVQEQGLRGLQFLPPQLNLYGDAGAWDRESFRPFWDGVVELGVPVFFSLGQMSNRSAALEAEPPALDDYLAEVATLVRWIERYPEATVVLTHGLNWRMFMTGDRLEFPEAVWRPFESPNTRLQLLFPIALGAVWDYPMPQARGAVQECVQRIGAGRLMWGTDMPIVGRFWTYRQNIDFIRRYCDFLSAGELHEIMGGAVAKLLGVEWPAAPDA